MYTYSANEYVYIALRPICWLTSFDSQQMPFERNN